MIINNSEFIEKCRDWQKINSDWELICDIDNSEKLYIQWDELGKKEKMTWVGKYRQNAKEMFEEFGQKSCKVEKGFLNLDMQICNNFPHGHGMAIFKTYKQKKVN